ncbi:MAG: sulfotransferase family 2 domain-containing protein [Paracoccaceae bacterium]
MLVSNDHKFIYLKTPKTAGTSMEMYLQPLCTADGVEVTHETDEIVSDRGIVGFRGEKSLRPKKTVWRNHMSLMAILNRLPDAARDYALIANVRNPFDRAVSYYRYTHRPGKAEPAPSFDADMECFRAFLAGPTYSNYLPILSLNGSVQSCHFLRFEHLETDIGALHAALNLPALPQPLQHVKQSVGPYVGRPIADYYDATSRDRVLQEERWCFDKFQYSEDPREA